MTDARLAALRERIATFPKTPGVYLMKDAEDRVLYVGKAKDLRARVMSYFQPSADLLGTRGPDICRMVEKVRSIDFLECETEVDALLKEARLIKDIQPPHNAQLKDGKTFPYIEITTGDDFPGVFVTRTPRLKGSKLYGPFPTAGSLRDAVNALQKAFKFRTCELEILDGDDSRRFFRPCLLHAINQCTAPCAALISNADYRDDIDRLRRFLGSKRSTLVRQLTKEMEAAAADRRFEEAAKLRDQVKAIKSLSLSGDVDEDMQPEVFYVDPKKGLESLADLLGLETPPRCMECVDIAHLQGSETVGSLVCFIDGKPFKSGYRRFKIKTVEGVDDYAAIREVITRRYRHAVGGEELFPDVILIDGGLGQLHAGLEAFERMRDASDAEPVIRDEADTAPGGSANDGAHEPGAAARLRRMMGPVAGGLRPPMVISLAKREEEIYIQARRSPLRLPRNNEALRILQQMRDEAHRFAQAYHHKLRKKRVIESNDGQGAPRKRASRRPPSAT